ncbi:HpcH/HpaI aldolase/citrate lyase family protein [Aestuariivita sp.]|jgi:4-hydroxy-2-oxoheptanedioate aldolase|uniref:HpcH/HpaI aldolase/citrate lyase family protein n=1 Tax=Aestuariivita sp. TaxID=1872407 RepID=UPI00217151A8|nr:HpcH/HpaI aldolase/citrate lyase family protein [Aestuariivita sp.]MCE8007641.1 HpcH/HpaI aldolase/citrate lyase family protein [Aestuariivita sp.]
MPAPVNTFKKRLQNGERLIGCWMGLSDLYAAEILGTAGFDWIVVDGEHAPNDIRSMRDQLIALEASDSHPVVRLPIGETWMIKQVLDIGAQTVLVPVVESKAQAEELVRACRYPPEGTRGVGAALARASRFSAIPDYATTADAQICLLVQVESRAGIAALDDILTVEGVDGVFIGPADLSADMGYTGNPGAREVQEVILGALARIAAAGKAPGILSINDAVTEIYRDAGAQFLAVGIDVLMLARTAREAAKKWKP